ncbi:hypothetical protein TCAL_09504 [Tigriopus californicus]|uniref:SET domain-containing protein n=1 Tax=Tigriopus californicus TaxID=6832 RepID=A0A553PCN2_TIGCA|nr:histone-lysine N-methyltransferase SETD7-like [Tigriopus californicus]TRY75439.1 hypothetical protein TCAL_09504 [Tigriopus californicus]|eukprot:TCALIF_09504-PA protein Name:"Similar to setd7 Histone-lysine N-methyltransferase SETD7 (Xenopus tropicalis)" AED:0.12 eAED:0.12 QI:0/0/0/1/1/1/2/0/433
MESRRCSPQIIRTWWNDLVKFGFKTLPSEESSALAPTSNPNQAKSVEDFVAYDPYSGELGDLEHTVVDELPCGYKTIRLEDETILEGTWRKGLREGKGLIRGGYLQIGPQIQAITGIYRHGVLQGLGKVFLESGICLEGQFRQGFLHGPVCGYNPRGSLVFVGCFDGGRPIGIAWKWLEGDGFLYGRLDRSGEFTGSNIAYLYPDLVTCLIGEFANGQLVQGRESKIQDAHMHKELLKLRFHEPRGPTFMLWKSTLTEIRVPPLQEDLYEKKYVEVRDSQLPGAGDGLFAKVPLTQGATVAFYNGIRVRPNDTPPFQSRDYEIYVDWNKPGSKSDYMDLPPEFISIENYRASLGHKINHSFAPNCAWDVVEHPVFGRIPRIVTLRDIEPNEELTCHYKIDMEEAVLRDNLAWYVAQWGKLSQSMQDTQKMSEE